MTSRARRIARCGKVGVLIGMALAFCVSTANAEDTATPTDEVTVKGDVLHGKVLSADPKAITFEPEYAKGTLTIPFEDISNIVTENQVQFLYGDGEEVYGRILSYSDGKLQVGQDAAGATTVELTSLHSATAISPEGPTWQDRMRSYWRYWDGNFDFSYSLQQATIDSNALSLALGVRRTAGPTRLSLLASYLYSTQEESTATGDKTTVIQDRAFGSIRFEYDLTDRLYAFGSGDAEYDAIQDLSIRGIPKAGLGYFFYRDESGTNYFSGEMGGAWVYEKYFRLPDGSSNPANTNYFSVAFGLRAGLDLWYGTRFEWAFDYLPAVDNWANDYLLRSDASYLLPLVGPVGFKLTLLNIYDSITAPGTDHNSLYFTAGLSLAF